MSVHELQARLKALDEARHKRKEATTHEAFSAWDKAAFNAQQELEAAARRVAEGAGEPVAWQVIRGGRVISSLTRPPVDGEVAFDEGETVRPLYTTPPSADALVEALGKLSAEWRESSGLAEAFDTGRHYCADELDALIAKHKENTDGR